jgi:hypothetical protein
MKPQDLIGLKYKKMIRGILTDSYFIGNYMIDRRSIEVTRDIENAYRMMENGSLVALVRKGIVVGIIGDNPENEARFSQINSEASSTLNGLTKGKI